MSFRILTNKPIVCPHCSKSLDGATGDRWPTEGDISVCIYCTKILQFAGKGMDMRLVPTSDIFLKELQQSHPDLFVQISRIQQAISQIDR